MAEEIDLNTLAGLFDAPAYVRRARGVEQALAHVIGKASAVRQEWLQMPRLRLGVLAALAGEWPALRPLVANEAQLEVLASVNAHLAPKLRLVPRPTQSQWALRSALRVFVASARRFNGRWDEHLRKIDVSEVNRLRDGYNRYYLLEKAAAIKNEAVVRQGYSPLSPLGYAELERHLPLLPIPELA